MRTTAKATAYRGSCLQFLLFKGGKQVACVEGVDPPGLLAAVNKQLAAASGAAAAHRSSDSEEE